MQRFIESLEIRAHFSGTMTGTLIAGEAPIGAGAAVIRSDPGQLAAVAQSSDSLIPESAVVRAGGSGTASGWVKITNTGSTAPASGKSRVEIYSSPDGSYEDTLLTTISAALSLRANQSRVVNFRLNASEQAQAASDGYIIFDVYDPSGSDHIYGLADSAPQTKGNAITELYSVVPGQTSQLDLSGSETFTSGSQAGQTDDGVYISIDGLTTAGKITGGMDADFAYAPRSLRNAKVAANGRFSAKVETSIVSLATVTGQLSVDQATGVVTLTGTFRDGSAAGTFTASGWAQD